MNAINEKQAYEQKVQAQIDRWNADMDRLKAEAMTADADTKLKLDEQLNKLTGKKKQAEAELDKLRRAGEDAWEDMKIGIDQSLSIFGESVKSAVQRFTR